MHNYIKIDQELEDPCMRKKYSFHGSVRRHLCTMFMHINIYKFAQHFGMLMCVPAECKSRCC